MDCMTKTLSLSAIMVATRIRKDAGAIEELAADIHERGLINPITVMGTGNGSYQLIAGLRRVDACKRLGFTDIRATVLSPMAADEALKMEYAENVQRKDFTVDERLEYAEKIKEIEKVKAEQRQKLHARDGYLDEMDKKQVRDNCPTPEKGRIRDIVAQRAGFSSGRQYERAALVAEKCPELLDKIDTGEMTISGAYKRARVITQNEAITENPAPTPLAVHDEKPQNDPIVRAQHDRLMKNPLYAELWEKHKKAVADANVATTELKFRTQGFENRIRNYEDNVGALRRRCEFLEEENAALRTQIANKNTAEV